MNWEKYKSLAARTMLDRGKEHNFLHMNAGIGTELFELMDIFKRNYAYDKDVDLIHVSEEIGDTFWYEANRERLFPELTFDVKEYQFNSIEDIMYSIIDFNIMEGSTTPLLMAMIDYFELDLDLILTKNIKKLKGRFPDKFNTVDALNRNLDNERKILES